MRIELPGPLLLAGAGKMGGALLSGLIAKGLDPRTVYVQDPQPAADVADLLGRHGIVAKATLASLPAPASVLLVAVKPQVIDDVLPGLAPLVGPETLVLSIAAGRTISGLARHLPTGTAIIRSMPNTPAAIGRGITVCTSGPGVTDGQRALAETLLAAVGEVAWVEKEALLDPVTAVSGSGPAYVFLLAECLAEAGRKAGLDAELADRLARATLAGSAELLARSGLDPARLRENVTSPGGTTAAALDVLMSTANGLGPLLQRAVAAATERSRALAK